MPIDFPAIERVVVEAMRRPTNADQKAACASLTKLTGEEKIRVLRLFVERARKRMDGGSNDWATHVYVKGAIGPREPLPWTRDDVEHFLAAVVEYTGYLPPAIVLRMVKEHASAAGVDAKLARMIERVAHAMWPDDDGEGALYRDTAAALRTLIGVAAKPKSKVDAKAKVAKVATTARQKAAPKPSARRSKVSFAEAVKQHMKRARPQYVFVSTGGGSGPLVTFARPSSKKMPHLVEHVVFQKGLHGASWFRVNLFASITGAGANGPMEHTVLEGASLGKDVRFATDDELDAALGTACDGLERGAAATFAGVEKRYAALDRLFGSLLASYARFLETDGAKLLHADFVDVEGSDPPRIVAFDAFMRFLAKKKLSFADKNLDLVTPLWRFWHNGRPMRATDYQKGDYYDCSRCAAFVALSRGKLVAKKVAGFGTHYAFVCKKH